MTNCVAFLPLLLVQGQTGEFIYSLPVVVTASLGQQPDRVDDLHAACWATIFCAAERHGVRRGRQGLERGRRAIYRRFCRLVPRPQGDRLTVCGWLCCGGAPCSPLLGTAFFPKDLHGVFSVNVYLAEGSPIRQTQRRGASRSSGDIENLEGDKSAPTRLSSAKAGRDSGSRSCPSNGPTTTPRSSFTRSIRATRRRGRAG